MTEQGRLLLVRADASPRIGMGHVMRCLALAQAWAERGGRAVFAMAGRDSPAAGRLHDEGMGIRTFDAERGTPADGERTAALVRELRPAWVVLDGYCFRSAYQRTIRAEGRPLLLLDDDECLDRYEAEMVLNQNVGAEARGYAARASHTRLLRGSRYVLLRREFREAQRPPSPAPASARAILVTLGGADPENVAERVLRGLLRLRRADLAIRLVAGGANPHSARLEAATAGAPCRVVVEQTVEDMPGAFRGADFVISAGGSTCYEWAYMRRPAAVCILADNQRPIAHALAERGAAHPLGEAAALTPDGVAERIGPLLDDGERRKSLARSAGELVDGAGSARVLDRMREVA